MEEEVVYHGLGCYIGGGDGCGPTGKTIDAGKELALAYREWEGVNQIHVDV